MRVLWNIFKKLLKILLLSFVLVLTIGTFSVRAAPNRIPIPLRPIIPTLPPFPKPLGTVHLTSIAVGCGTSRMPISAAFQLCRNMIRQENSPESIIPIRPKCMTLTTNSGGQVKASVAVGSYTIYPTSSCPPGAFCIMNKNLQPDIQIWEPYSWSISPQEFKIAGGDVVFVKAFRYNHLLMCPIQIENNQ